MKSDVSLKVNRQTWDAGIESGEPKWLPRLLHNCSWWWWWCDHDADDGNGGRGTHGDVGGNGGGVRGGGDSRGVHSECDKGWGTEVMVEVLVVMMLAMTVVGMEVMMEDGDRIPKLYFPGTQLLVREPIF